jgi:hypothetical protein
LNKYIIQLILAKSIDIQTLANARRALLPALLLPNFSEFSPPESTMAFPRTPPTINTKGKGRSNTIKAAIPTQNQYNKSSKKTHETPSTTSPNSDSEQWKDPPTQPPVLQSSAMLSQSNEELLREMIQAMQMQIQMQAQAQARAEAQAQARDEAEAQAQARASAQAQAQAEAQAQAQARAEAQAQARAEAQAQAQAEALAEARAQTQALQAQLQAQLQSQLQSQLQFQLQSQQSTASSDTLEQTRMYRRILQLHETNKITRQVYEKIKLKETMD